MPRTPAKDEKAEARALHEWVLATLFSRVQDGKTTFVRQDLEKVLCDAHSSSTSGTASQRKRVSGAVRTAINVLLGLKILIEVDATIKFNPLQAHYMENVDHFSHALFLFQEANDKLKAEEVVLVQQLINRVKDTRSLGTSTVQGGNGASNKGASGKPNGAPKNKKRKSEEGVHSEQVNSADSTSTELVLTIPEPLVSVKVNVAQRVNLEASVQRVRSLQLMLFRPGARQLVESTLNAHPERPKFAPSALGPLGANELAPGAKESRGSSVSMRAGNGSVAAQSNNGSAADAKPSTDLASTLKPGYEVELKTKSLNFADIAQQFELWNGQDSDVGVSGRSSPRPTPSPGADSHMSWHPSTTPSPPPPATSQHHASVRVPQWTKLQNEDLRKQLQPADSLTEEEIQEDKGLADASMLARHNSALDEFKIKYEGEQEQLKKMRREAREAGEKTARIVVAAARARSLSAAATKVNKSS